MSVLMVVALAGLAAVAVAGQSSTGTYNQGMQNRQMGSGNHGMQNRQMGSGGQSWGGQHGSNWNNGSRGNSGNMGNMSAEDMQKMQQERDAFLKETEGQRQDLYNKDLELRNELGKQDPDDRKVAGLQKEISQLETQLYRKRDEYMVRMQKINPNAGRGYKRGGGMMDSGGGRGMMDSGGGQGRMGTGGNNRW